MPIRVQHEVPPLLQTILAFAAGAGTGQRQTDLLEFQRDQGMRDQLVRTLGQVGENATGAMLQKYRTDAYQQATLDRAMLQKYGMTVADMDAARGTMSRADFINQLEKEKSAAAVQQEIARRKALYEAEMKQRGYVYDYSPAGQQQRMELASELDSIHQALLDGSISDDEAARAIAENQAKVGRVQKQWVPGPQIPTKDELWTQNVKEFNGELYGWDKHREHWTKLSGPPAKPMMTPKDWLAIRKQAVDELGVNEETGQVPSDDEISERMSEIAARLIPQQDESGPIRGIRRPPIPPAGQTGALPPSGGVNVPPPARKPAVPSLSDPRVHAVAAVAGPQVSPDSPDVDKAKQLLIQLHDELAAKRNSVGLNEDERRLARELAVLNRQIDEKMQERFRLQAKRAPKFDEVLLTPEGAMELMAHRPDIVQTVADLPASRIPRYLAKQFPVHADALNGMTKKEAEMLKDLMTEIVKLPPQKRKTAFFGR